MEIKCRTNTATLADGLVVIRPRFGRTENRIPVSQIARIETRRPSLFTAGAVAFHPTGIPVSINDTGDSHVLFYGKKQQAEVDAFVAAVEAERSGDPQHRAP